MIAVDTNILVYAHREDSPFHEAPSDAWQSSPRGRRRALTVEMIHKISEAWKIPADLLVRPYHLERAA